MKSELIEGNCLEFLNNKVKESFDLTFLDPPFNQGKKYEGHDDTMEASEYWKWMKEVSSKIIQNTSNGGCIYFMQREKNTQQVLETLSLTGWHFQNLIIWKKKSSAVPQNNRFGKQYQVIAFATKGNPPRVFNKLRINPPLLVTEKYQRENGMYVTDVWDDIQRTYLWIFCGCRTIKNQRRFPFA